MCVRHTANQYSWAMYLLGISKEEYDAPSTASQTSFSRLRRAKYVTWKNDSGNSRSHLHNMTGESAEKNNA